MLARLFVFFGGLLVLALTAALVGPYFIDWTNYRAGFEREASSILGRQVTVRGEASARLLPFPSVTFSDVAVAGGPGGEPALTVETFSMDAELAPFMRGEFLIFDMRLVRPQGTIDIAADGAVDWTMRPSAPIGADRISLEKVTITGGRIALRHAASGRTHLVSDIDAQISARSLHGPWRISGTLSLDGMAMAVSVSTGRAGSDGAMRLRVEADPARYPAVVEADGNIRLESGAAVYSGAFKLRPKPAAGESGAARAASAAPPPYRLGGSFTLDHRSLSVDEFLFETGPLENPYSAEGSGSIDLGPEPRFALSLEGAQIRFDEAVGGEMKAGQLTFADRLAALEAALVELPRPSMPGRIEVSLPAVVAGDTTVRDVRLSAEPAEGGWTLKSFAATLPGRATLEAGGKLRTEGQFGFAGYMLLAVAQPSGFAAWLARDVDDAIRRLPAAGFQARVNLTASRQTFTDLELALGDATFRGKADSRQPEGARPTTLVELSGGALDLDGLAAFAALFVNDEGASRFADHDLDLQIEAGPVSVAGLTAETVDTAMRLRDGLLEIDRLSIGDVAGATVSATGKLENFPSKPSGNVDASIVAVDLAPLIEAGAARFPENPFLRELQERAAADAGLFEDARIDVVATAAANDDGTTGVAASAQGTAGGTSFDLTSYGRGRPDAPAAADLKLSLQGRNEDAGRLLSLWGLPVLPLDMAGPAETSLTLKGVPAEGMDTAVSIGGEGLSAGFTGTTRIEEGALSANGKLELDAADLEPWLMTIGATLPGMGLGLPVALEAEAGYAEGRLSLADIAGTVNEGAVAGGIDVDMEEGKPHLTGQLTLDVLDLEPLAAMVLGEESLQSGEKAWPAAPFQQGSTAPFSANLGIEAGTLAAGPIGSASDARLSLRLDGEGLRVADLSARLFGGEAAGLLELRNNQGTGLFSGQLKLTGADMEQALGKQALHGTIDVSAALTASGKSIGGLVAGLSGSGTAALDGLVIDGINPDALAGFIGQADAIGKDIDAKKTASFVPEIAAAGSFRARPVEAAFTVAGGVLRAPPVKLDGGAASIEADLAVDLNRRRIAASGAIEYEAGEEALVGSEPVLRFAVEGPAGAAERSFNSEPLAQFLMQRALEIEQARVEAMQAALLEKQRLRREVRYYAALETERERAALEQARLERIRQEEARQRAEQERLQREEQARAEEQARRDAEAARARQEAEDAALGEAEKARQRDAEAARARRAAEDTARADADRDRQRSADEARRREAEDNARRKQGSGLPGVNTDPLARDTDNAPEPRNPFSIENLLRSLE